MAKGGSKFLTALIAFLLGFVFALLVEAGAIFGVYWFVANKDLDTIMSTVGLNNKDEEGNSIYINTDTENGGVSNVKELVSALQGLIYENGEVTALGKSIDDFENLIPATKKVLDLVYNTVDGYVELDKEEFESTPLSGLAQVLSDSLMNVKTANLLQKLNVSSITGDDANAIVKSLLMGAETEYATVTYAAAPVATLEAGEGGETDEGSEAATFKLPVFYDYYFYDEMLNCYYREQPDRASRFPQNLEGREEELLCEMAMEDKDGEFSNRRYKLFYVPCRVTESGVEEAEYSMGDYVYTDGNGKETKFSVVKFGADTDFIVIKPKDDGSYVLDHSAVYGALNSEKADDYSYRFTGYSYDVSYASTYYYTVQNSSTEKYEMKAICGKNYFKNNAGELMQLDALVLGDLITDAFAPLDSVTVCDVLGENSDIAYKVFGKTSLGELMRGEVDLNKIINDMEIGTVLNNVPPDNKVMAYVAYKISDLTPNPDGTYSAIYDKFGANERVTVYLDGGNISEVKRADGTVVDGVKINEVAAMASDMPVTVLMDVKTDDAIMTYLGYGVSALNKVEGITDYDYVGKVRVEGEAEKRDCFVTVSESGVICDVWYQDGENKVQVAGTKVSKIASRIDNFTNDLTISDVIEVKEDDRMLSAIAHEPISKIGEAVKDLTVEKMFTPQQVQGNAMLRELQGTKISELDKAIDELMIQSIYFEEVYRLPATADLMEVVSFDPSLKYYQVVEKETEGKKTLVFELVNSDGKLTQSDFDGRGKTVYYTKGEKLGEELADAKMKIVGFDETWLYYEADANNEGKHKLTEEMITSGMSESDKDNNRGHLTADKYAAGVAKNKKYYSYGFARGMWNLVLYKNGLEKAYTMNNFNNMVNSCADNVYKSTLGELQDAGIVTLEDAKLNKKMRVVETVGGVPQGVKYLKKDEGTDNLVTTDVEADGLTMREMTLMQLLDVVATYMPT